MAVRDRDLAIVADVFGAFQRRGIGIDQGSPRAERKLKDDAVVVGRGDRRSDLGRVVFDQRLQLILEVRDRLSAFTPEANKSTAPKSRFRSALETGVMSS